jgi:zinc D-Ala-D-Ala carboxypeptidase
MQLTPHISFEELIRSEIGERLGFQNVPGPEVRANLKTTAEVMERIRMHLGRPVAIHSGYRSPAVNLAVGGVATSAHCFGLACDFSCPEFGTPYQVAKAIETRVKEFGIDQLIREYGWVHVGLRVGEPRNELLTKASAASPYQSGILC